jgi:hypothetical protein
MELWQMEVVGGFRLPPVEVLFDRVCRENEIEHLLTQPRSPTTTGMVERSTGRSCTHQPKACMGHPSYVTDLKRAVTRAPLA